MVIIDKLQRVVEIITIPWVGYPNLYTLLRAYPDIFVVEIGPSQDRSEIGLVAQGDCNNILNVKLSSLHFPFILVISKATFRQPEESFTKQQKPMMTNKSVSDRLMQSLVPVDNKPNCIDVIASQNYTKQNQRENALYNSLLYNNNKENSYSSSLNGSFNSSMSYDPNSSVASTGSYGSGHIGLWNRRQERYLRDHQDMNFLTIPLYQHYAPPKPDTPPSDVS